MFPPSATAFPVGHFFSDDLVDPAANAREAFLEDGNLFLSGEVVGSALELFLRENGISVKCFATGLYAAEGRTRCFLAGRRSSLIRGSSIDSLYNCQFSLPDIAWMWQGEGGLDALGIAF